MSYGPSGSFGVPVCGKYSTVRAGVAGIATAAFGFQWSAGRKLKDVWQVKMREAAGLLRGRRLRFRGRDATHCADAVREMRGNCF